MRHAIVTGATSMIGVATIKECLKKGVDVTAIVRKNSSRISRLPNDTGLQIIHADSNDWSHLELNVKGDVFYHFAWSHTEKSGRDDVFLQEENVRASLEAALLAKRVGCSKFIGAGSQAEYGIIKGKISADDTPTNPISAYGMAKLSAGLLIRRFCEQNEIKYIWGRIFSVYGVNDNEGTMIDYALKQFRKGESAYFSAGTQMWNYLHEDDAGKMFFLLGQKDIANGIYCIANSESKPLRQFIEIIGNACGSLNLCLFSEEDNNLSTVSLEADITKTVRAIEYIPSVGFHSGIKRILEKIV